ncbi:MAG: DMT family transporter [Candidatus Diapherotrites archaeon]|nr:DMT family transporter [Candidatus Diapherotrites archaeon]
MEKGAKLVFATALVSGVSIFLNSVAVNTLKVEGMNSLIFTTLNNLLVAIMLGLAILMLGKKPCIIFERKLLSRFIVIGLIGGCLPFFMYFHALSLITSPAQAGFIHKTLFIWATFFAIFLIKERVNIWFFVASLLLLAGNYFMSMPKAVFGFAEALALGATILWALENVIARKMLIKEKIGGLDLAFARMFYGSIFMVIGLLIFMPATVFSPKIGYSALMWLVITALMLLLYVSTYYSGLKHIEVHKATSILLIEQPITLLLSFAFEQTTASTLRQSDVISDVIGASLILFGIFALFSASHLIGKVIHKVPMWVKSKH